MIYTCEDEFGNTYDVFESEVEDLPEKEKALEDVKQKAKGKIFDAGEVVKVGRKFYVVTEEDTLQPFLMLREFNSNNLNSEPIARNKIQKVIKEDIPAQTNTKKKSPSKPKVNTPPKQAPNPGDSIIVLYDDGSSEEEPLEVHKAYVDEHNNIQAQFVVSGQISSIIS